MCEQQYLLSYVLGIPQDSNKKAEMGTIFHKVMECLAEANIAVKAGQDHFIDKYLGMIPVTDKTIGTDAFLDRMFNLAFNYYTFPDRTRHVFSPADKKSIHSWVYHTMTSSYGLFDPRKRNVVAVEQHFDFPIDEPWAHYNFPSLHGGDPISGTLSMKGTIDLITQVGPSMYEIVDWKSGKRMDWSDGSEKGFDKLSVDPQLRMYHYAVTKLYPKIKNVAITINFVRPDQGGPFTMAFGPDDIKATLAMLKQRFEAIKQCTRPKLKSNSGSHWFCKKVCSYGRNPHPKDPTQTICQYIKQKTIRQGLDAVIRDETAVNHSVDYYENPGE